VLNRYKQIFYGLLIGFGAWSSTPSCTHSNRDNAAEQNEIRFQEK